MDITGLIERAIEIFDPLYNKIKGGYFAIAAAVTGIVTLIISSFLYSSATIPPFETFSIFSHWVSNLGGAWTNLGLPPNGSNLVFSAGLIIASIIAIPAVIYLLKILIEGYQRSDWLIPLATISGISCIIGVIGLAIFDMKTSIMFHVGFAAILFVGGAYMIHFFSLKMLLDAEISKIYGILGILMASSGLMFSLTLLPNVIQGADVMLLIVSTSPGLALTRFWEWMFVFSIFEWFILMGIFTLTHEA